MSKAQLTSLVLINTGGVSSLVLVYCCRGLSLCLGECTSPIFMYVSLRMELLISGYASVLLGLNINAHLSSTSLPVYTLSAAQE